MRRSTVIALLLGTVLVCQACSKTQETAQYSETTAEYAASSSEITYKQIDSDKFAEEFVRSHIKFHDGEMGYSIKVTRCAYEVYVLAYEYDINSADPDAVRKSLESEVAKLSDADKECLMLNNIEVVELLNECTAGEISVEVFSDVNAAEEMKELLFNTDAHNSWVAVKEIYSSLF